MYMKMETNPFVVAHMHIFIYIYIYIYTYTYIYIYMGASVLYPSRQNSLDYPCNKPRNLFYIITYGLRIILCVRAHHITESTGVGLGPIEPRARDQGPRSCWAGAWGPAALGPWALVPGPRFYGFEPDPSRLGNIMGPDA